jgi:hypothetical protein
MGAYLGSVPHRIIVMSLIAAFLVSATGAQQSKGRVITITSLPSEPLRITGIRVRGTQIESGKEFQAGDEWLRGLAVSVTNVSNKPICFIDVALYFPREAHDGRRPARDALMFACDPVNSKIPNPLKPGKSMNLVITDGDYVAQGALLARNKYPATINRVEIGVYEIVFQGDKDRKWVKGQMMQQDPDHPGEWIPIKQ